MSKRKKYLMMALGIAIIILIAIAIIVNQPIGGTVDVTTTTKELKREETTSHTIEPEPTTVAVDGVENPLTGLLMPSLEGDRRALAVVFDNFYSARPQRSLIQADIGIECLVEGLITRYVGIFYSEFPTLVGPIRSARPYLAAKALEFDPYFVHVGGSMQALSDIIRWEMADIDGMHSGAFDRYPPKKAPHNMYATWKDLRQQAIDYHYYTNITPYFSMFDTISSAHNGEAASVIKIVYKKPGNGDSVGYRTSYKYDAEQNIYYRYTNGSPHIDQETEEQLYATNIIVQETSHRVLDKAGRLEVTLLGKGRGILFSEGKMIPLTWEKNELRERTIYKDQQGNEITLSKGKTWIQVTPGGITQYGNVEL